MPNERTHDSVKACTSLISAILVQAFSDALSTKRECNSRSAKNFINPNNELFCYYCGLIDLDPEWVARKLQARILKRDLRPLTQLKD